MFAFNERAHYALKVWMLVDCQGEFQTVKKLRQEYEGRQQQKEST